MEDQKEHVVGGYRFDRISDAGEAALEILNSALLGEARRICWQFMIKYWMKEFLSPL